MQICEEEEEDHMLITHWIVAKIGIAPVIQ